MDLIEVLFLALLGLALNALLDAVNRATGW